MTSAIASSRWETLQEIQKRTNRTPGLVIDRIAYEFKAGLVEMKLDEVQGVKTTLWRKKIN